jgi:protein-S-isoprenylcysteine O-methyltransferase Ste14
MVGGAGSPPEHGTAATWSAVVAAYLLVPLIAVGVSGDLGWWQAWVLSLLVLLAGVVGRVWADRRHPGLQADRMRFGRGQRVMRWDRVLSPLMGVTVLYLPVVVGALDHRFGWTPPFPAWVNATGLLVCALGYAFAVWALVENRFFTSLVRIQTDRGHEVCDSGPYRLVRHPGYAGNLLAVVGIPVALDSAWAYAASGVALAVSALRTGLEDRALQDELPGYREYATRVPYRLLPGLW